MWFMLKPKKIASIPIILGAITWLFSETIKDILFGWVSNRVIAFFKEKGMTFFLDLSLEYGIPIVLLLIGLYLWFFESGEKKTKFNQGNDLNPPSGKPEHPAAKLDRDVWLLEAIYYVAEGSWDSPNYLAKMVDEIEDPTYPNRVADASRNILQKAADGELQIWGKVNDRTPFTKIEPSYWNNHDLGFWEIIKGKSEAGKLESAAIGIAEGPIYGQLKTNRDKVEKLWPKSIKSEIRPDVNMEDAINHVVNVLFPNKNPDHRDITREDTEAIKLINKKLRSGELAAWGKRIEIIPVHGGVQYKPHTTSNDMLFTKEDWEYRELIPLSASIPREDKPQTRSYGSGEDHIQLTALRVNLKQVEKLWPLERI
jgi:hypothetical protein